MRNNSDEDLIDFDGNQHPKNENSQQSITQIDINIFERIFDESIEDLKRLGCLNHNQKYTGIEVEELLSFLKIPLISRISMNSLNLVISNNDIDTAKPSSIAATVSKDNNSFKNKQKKPWDPGEPCCSRSIEEPNPNVQNSSGNIFTLDVDEVLKTHLSDEIENGFLTENDSDHDANSGPEFKKVSNKLAHERSTDSPPLVIPNLDKLLDKNKTIENDDDMNQSSDNDVEQPKSKIIQSTKIFDEADDDIDELDHNDDLNIREISSIYDDEGLIPQNLTTVIENVEELFNNDHHEYDNEDDERSIQKVKSDKTIYLSVEDNENDDNDFVKDDNTNKKSSEFAKIDTLLKKFNSIDSSGTDDDNDGSPSNNLTKKRINNPKSLRSYVDDDDQSNNDIMTDEEFPPPPFDDNDEEMITIKRKKRKLISSEDEEEDISTVDNSDENQQSIEPMLNDTDKKTSTSKNDSQLLNSTEMKKKRRKRRKRIVIDDDSSHSDDNSDDGDDDDECPDKDSTRKKIRKMLKGKSLRDETKNAEKAERERRKRIEEKQKLYNSISEEIIDPIGKENEECKRLILDIDKKTKEILVEVDKNFVQMLKPHQIEGIKFMFDSTIESVERLKEHAHESGCILAHSMGLGKTLQVIAFLHTIMTNLHIRDIIKHVLIIVPLNVAKNWIMEFIKWLEFDSFSITIYETTTTKNLSERIKILQNWRRNGGVMIITITLFSQLISGKKFTKKQKAQDFPVMDEGHLLKNEKTIFNCTISQIRTLRRVILTGTPLQNNLSEYFIMVDFVKPNLLGTKREFKNRFENPISNGQHIDSTDNDVRYMKRRVHVLHQKLKDVINRHDYNVLVPYLKPKFEFALTIKLTQIQIDLYKNYLDNFTSASNGKNLLNDFTVLRYIWNHPATLVDQCRQKMEKAEEDPLKDFIVNDYDDDIVENIKTESNGVEDNNDGKSADESDIECVFDNLEELHKSRRLLRSKGQAPDIPKNHENLNGLIDDGDGGQKLNWWKNVLKDYDDDDIYRIELSSKFILLFSILEECEKVGDKILVFSQSLHNLDLIETLLSEKNCETNEKFGENIDYNELAQKNDGVSNRWIRDIDYFRIDGKVNCDNRANMIKNFNDNDDHRLRLMLISTKAGGLGINLIGANRCIIFDASWNPTHDIQAIYRIFRYGQEKPVYIYRFISYGTMEQKIYDRQIIKQSMALRVIDEHQITRYFKQAELAEMYTFIADPPKSAYKCPPVEAKNDRLICDIYEKHKDLIVSFHQHDSLLENRPEENLTEEERLAAWEEFQRESEPVPTNILPTNTPNLLVNSPPQLNIPMMTSLLQQRYNKSMLTGTIIPTHEFYAQSNEAQYYNSQYAQSQPQLQRQEYIAPSSYNMSLLQKPINDQMLIRYFNQMTEWMQQYPINDHLRYRNLTVDAIRNEFHQQFIHLIGSKDEYFIKFYLYVNYINLFLRRKLDRSQVMNNEIINNLARIKDEVIQNCKLERIAFRLNEIIHKTGRSLRAQQQQQHQSLIKLPVQNENIECIHLDSD
ncbi:hypothetical protein DERF_007633 [Dermatophagoides farinae]|uniref:Transcriptional regulator ATRX homolog n=1 Tax=Dermatophagoides farinae TaxID=6954 RepID=A0A922I3V6_DERFA|nr:hypothetical protein DERF_007633 [Dermatophagoides farinae]